MEHMSIGARWPGRPEGIDLGPVLITKGVWRAFANPHDYVEAYIIDHARGDWDGVTDHELHALTKVMAIGGVIRSIHITTGGDELWIHTFQYPKVTIVSLAAEWREMSVQEAAA